jgi:hypothetical protein
MRCAISAFTASAMWMSAASAATFSTSPTKDDDVIVTLSGEIAEGDAHDLKALIQRENDDGQTVAIIRLNSPGGSILESVKLADIIRDAKIATSVIGTAKCASACFIVFAAGSKKFVSSTALVGVHGASDESGQETVESGAATVSMARIAKDLGVPPSIIGKMVVTPPDEIVWLSPDDLRSMGTTIIGNSDQLTAGRQPAGQLSAGPSSDSPMSAQFPHPDKSTTAQPSAPSWESLLDRAIELSKKQHDGTPDFERVCQPELKECINGLSFTAPDGTAMIMKVTENMDGKAIRREVCSFNKFGDVRTCVDWDTGKQHRDVKDKDGNWYDVDDK